MDADERDSIVEVSSFLHSQSNANIGLAAIVRSAMPTTT
jgi:hypothetical protein